MDMNNKQQMAVEWFANQLSFTQRAIYNGVIEQAKEMEKERMIDFAYNALKIADNTRNRYVDVDKLYNELYGGGEQ
jgi:hypothetical protein